MNRVAALLEDCDDTRRWLFNKGEINVAKLVANPCMEMSFSISCTSEALVKEAIKRKGLLQFDFDRDGHRQQEHSKKNNSYNNNVNPANGYIVNTQNRSNAVVEETQIQRPQNGMDYNNANLYIHPIINDIDNSRRNFQFNCSDIEPNHENKSIDHSQHTNNDQNLGFYKDNNFYHTIANNHLGEDDLLLDDLRFVKADPETSDSPQFSHIGTKKRRRTNAYDSDAQQQSRKQKSESVDVIPPSQQNLRLPRSNLRLQHQDKNNNDRLKISLHQVENNTWTDGNNSKDFPAHAFEESGTTTTTSGLHEAQFHPSEDHTGPKMLVVPLFQKGHYMLGAIYGDPSHEVFPTKDGTDVMSRNFVVDFSGRCIYQFVWMQNNLLSVSVSFADKYDTWKSEYVIMQGESDNITSLPTKVIMRGSTTSYRDCLFCEARNRHCTCPETFKQRTMTPRVDCTIENWAQWSGYLASALSGSFRISGEVNDNHFTDWFKQSVYRGEAKTNRFLRRDFLVHLGLDGISSHRLSNRFRDVGLIEDTPDEEDTYPEEGGADGHQHR